MVKWDGNMMAQRYANEILRPLLVPYALAFGNSSLSMQDNAKPHAARLVENLIETETIFSVWSCQRAFLICIQSACLGHTQTTCCCKPNASCLCASHGNFISSSVEQYSLKYHR
ncbi:hypothetical protein TNCV_3773171 [Trichonephila clavipes]|nr:hypothetical protein TNCV_3773171 [Trichonephila clavipes]